MVQRATGGLLDDAILQQQFLSFDNSDGLVDSRDCYISKFLALISISCLLTRSAGPDANPMPSGCGGLHSSFSSWGFKSPLAVISWDLGGSSLSSQSSAEILGVQVPPQSLAGNNSTRRVTPARPQHQQKKQHDKTRNTTCRRR